MDLKNIKGKLEKSLKKGQNVYLIKDVENNKSIRAFSDIKNIDEIFRFLNYPSNLDITKISNPKYPLFRGSNTLIKTPFLLKGDSWSSDPTYMERGDLIIYDEVTDEYGILSPIGIIYWIDSEKTKYMGMDEETGMMFGTSLDEIKMELVVFMWFERGQYKYITTKIGG